MKKVFLLCLIVLISGCSNKSVNKFEAFYASLDERKGIEIICRSKGPMDAVALFTAPQEEFFQINKELGLSDVEESQSEYVQIVVEDLDSGKKLIPLSISGPALVSHIQIANQSIQLKYFPEHSLMYYSIAYLGFSW